MRVQACIDYCSSSGINTICKVLCSDKRRIKKVFGELYREAYPPRTFLSSDLKKGDPIAIIAGQHPKGKIFHIIIEGDWWNRTIVGVMEEQ